MTTPHAIRQMTRNCECALWAHHNLTPFNTGTYTGKSCPPALSTGEKPSPVTMQQYLKYSESYWTELLAKCMVIEALVNEINELTSNKNSYISDITFNQAS